MALALLLAAGCGIAPPTQSQAAEIQGGAMSADPAAGERRVMPSSLADMWYPGKAEDLKATLDAALAKADDLKLDGVRALLLPHAGYRYSAAVAAWGVKQVAGKPLRRVLILGPSHGMAFRDTVALSDATHWETPLGLVALDREVIAVLAAKPGFKVLQAAHAEEHSVQIEVPLLQAVLPRFTLVPMVVGRLSAETAQQIAAALRPFIDEATLVVISSDFTHYGPRFAYTPFHTEIQDNLKKLDMEVFGHIERKDLDGLRACLDTTGATVCGSQPIAVLLALLGPEQQVRLLRYDTSGAIEGGRWTNSVSYLAAAVTGPWPAAAPPTGMLSAEAKTALLRLARASIAFQFDKGRPGELAELGGQVLPTMDAVMGAFVTLKKGGDLRGCIGEIMPSRPVYQAVIARALDSAFHDRRFRPLTRDELAKATIEISALHPPRPVASYKDIVIGKHGMVLRKDGYSAVFLPQVAPEQGWTLEETLRHLSMKAGLEGDAWREGASFEVFEAEVFHE